MSYSEFLRRVATVFAFATFLALFWMLRGVFLIAFLSVILAMFLGTPVAYLQRLGLHRRYAVAITVVTTATVAVLFLLFLVPVSLSSVAVLIRELPEAYDLVVEDYTEWRNDQRESVRQLLPELSTQTSSGTIDKAIVPRAESDTSSEPIPIDSITSVVLPSLGELGQLVANTLASVALIIIVSLFFLAAPLDYLEGFMYLVPPHYHQKAADLISEINRALRSWMSAISLSITTTFALVSIWLNIILQIPNGIAIGIIAGATTLIPNIGVVIPLIPIIVFTLADDPNKLPAALIGYYIIQQVEGNFITPFFVKQQANIPAGLVLLFQLVAAVLFGFLGIILAVPLLVVTMVIIRELYVFDILGLRHKTITVQFQDKERQFEVQVHDNAPAKA